MCCIVCFGFTAVNKEEEGRDVVNYCHALWKFFGNEFDSKSEQNIIRQKYNMSEIGMYNQREINIYITSCIVIINLIESSTTVDLIGENTNYKYLNTCIYVRILFYF